MDQYLQQLMEPLLMQSYATLFFVSFILCLTFYPVVTAFAAAKLMVAIQSPQCSFLGLVDLHLHKHPRTYTPAVFGFIPLSIVFDLDAEQLTFLILSAAPVFSVGLAEDLGYNVFQG